MNTSLPTFEGIDEDDIPEDIFWESVMSTMEACKTYQDLHKVAIDLSAKMPDLRPFTGEIPFKVESEYIDAAATESLPADGPKHVYAVKTTGDGNCLCRALSRAFYGDESMHAELRARIVVEGIINMKKYLDQHHMEKGASLVREDEEFLKPMQHTVISI